MNQISVFTDGGSRGNPGPAAIGVFITNEKKENIASIGKKIGENTNNVAEYMAVLEAFSFLVKSKDKLSKDTKISFFMDSQLVYSQIVGIYKVKNNNLRDILFKIREKEAELGFQVFYNHIGREENSTADRLVNNALDNLI